MAATASVYEEIISEDSGEININLIYKTDNSITKVKEYIYNYDRNSDLNDLARKIIEEKLFDMKRKNSVIICNYDDDTIAQIIKNFSERNRGMIDWNINVREYPLIKYKKCLNGFYPSKALTVWCEECQGGLGSSGATGATVIFKILKILYNWILPICIKIYLFTHKVDRAYKKLEEITGYDKNFIKLVITKSYMWKKNFITDYYFSEKEKLEKIVMKDLKYKYDKKNKIYSNYNNLGC